jgi:hypothetical protein
VWLREIGRPERRANRSVFVPGLDKKSKRNITKRVKDEDDVVVPFLFGLDGA